MTDQISNIGLGVDSSGVKQATKDLKDFAAQGGATEKEVKKLGKAAREAQQAAEKQAKAEAKAMRERADAARKLGDTVGTVLRRAFIAAGAAAAGVLISLELLARSIGKYQDLAEETNSDPAGLASLQQAADVAGESIEGIAKAMVRMTVTLAKTDDESKGVGKALAAIGIEVSKFKQLRPDEQFRVLAEHMGRYADTQEKTALAQRLFGLGGARMLKVMKELEEQQTSGNALTNEQIRLADAYADAQVRARSEVKLFAQQLVANSLPAMTAMQEVIVNLVKEMVGIENQSDRLAQDKAIQAFAESVALGLAQAADAVRQLAHDLSGLSLLFDKWSAKRNVGVKVLTLADNSELRAAEAERDRATLAYEQFLRDNFDGDKVSKAFTAALAKVKAAAAKAAAEGKKGDGRPRINSRAFLGAGSDEQSKVLRAQLQSDLSDIQTRLRGTTSEYDNTFKILEARRSAGLIDEREYFAERRRLLEANAEAEANALDAEVAILQQQKVEGASAIENKRKIAEIDAKIAILRAQSAAQLTVLGIQETAAAQNMARAYREAQQSLEEFLETQRRQQKRDLDALGKGQAERERTSGRNAIEDRFQDQRSRLDQTRELLQLEGKWTQESQDQYERRVELIRNFRERALEEFDQYFDRRKELEQNAALGFDEALANYLDTARNTAKQTEDLFTKAFTGIEDAITNFVMTGKLSFSDLAKSIIADLTRIWVKQKLVWALQQIGKSSGGGLLGSIIGAITGGGARADGGDVAAGRSYLVGERGMEVFTPKVSGYITPNDELGGGGGVTIVQHNQFGNNTSMAEIAAFVAQNNSQLEQRILRSKRRNGAHT